MHFQCALKWSESMFFVIFFFWNVNNFAYAIMDASFFLCILTDVSVSYIINNDFLCIFKCTQKTFSVSNIYIPKAIYIYEKKRLDVLRKWFKVFANFVHVNMMASNLWCRNKKKMSQMHIENLKVPCTIVQRALRAHINLWVNLVFLCCLCHWNIHKADAYFFLHSKCFNWSVPLFCVFLSDFSIWKDKVSHVFFAACTWAHILISVLFYLNEWTSYILFFSVVIRPTMLFFSLHALLYIERTQCTSIVKKKFKSSSVMQFIRCTH